MERRVAEQIAAKAVRKTSDLPQAPASARRTQSGRSDIPPWKQSAAQSGQVPVASEEEDDEFLETVVKASTVDDPPHSGVRINDPGEGGARPLTFTVYSVEELDARQRVPAPTPSAPAPAPSRWPVVLTSAKALLRTWQAWYKSAKPRPSMMTACGVAVATLRVDLFAALKELPWRKIAIRGGAVLAALCFVLFVIFLASDDEHQASAASHAVAAKVEITDTAEAKPAEVVDIELDDEPAVGADKKPVVSAKKPAGKKHPAR